jgi:hypothetical protein
MHSRQLRHTNYDYIAAAIEQLKDDRDLNGLTPTEGYAGADINVSCSLQVSQRGADRKDHSCVLLFQTLVSGLAEKNSLDPGDVYVTLRTIFHARSISRNRMADHLRVVLLLHPDECLKALGRGEHVHESFLGPLVEELQLLMQQYTKPQTRSGKVKPPNKLAPRSTTKHTKSQVVVQKSSDAAKRLLTNDILMAGYRITPVLGFWT